MLLREWWTWHIWSFRQVKYWVVSTNTDEIRYSTLSHVSRGRPTAWVLGAVAPVDVEKRLKRSYESNNPCPAKNKPSPTKTTNENFESAIAYRQQESTMDDELWRLLDQPLLLNESSNQMENMTRSKLSSDISPNTRVGRINWRLRCKILGTTVEIYTDIVDPTSLISCISGHWLDLVGFTFIVCLALRHLDVPIHPLDEAKENIFGKCKSLFRILFSRKEFQNLNMLA